MPHRFAVPDGTAEEVRRRLSDYGEVTEFQPDAEKKAAEILRTAEAVVLSGAPDTLLSLSTLVHRLEPAVQVIAVASPKDRKALERSLLFAQGVGELWFAEPDDLGGGILERAVTVTRQRRRYRTTRRRLEEEMEVMPPSVSRRALISDAYLATLLEVLPDPVLSIDDQACVLSWNPAAERLFGRARNQAVGRPVREVIQPLDPGALDALLRSSDGRVAEGEIRVPDAAGEIATLEIVVVPVEAGGHQVRSVVLHDVTEQRRARRALEEQAAELEAQSAQLYEQASELELLNAELYERTTALEEAVEARSRFYAAMSHELRTPMNAIIGYNSLLLDGIYGELRDEQRDAVMRGQRAAQHLLELVNDVLDLAKIEAGRVDLRIEPTSVPRLLEELVDTVRPVADMHETQLETELQDCADIPTDPRRVRQILLNLLSNAIKFSEQKPVRVSCSAAPEGGVRIGIHDRGPGIRPEDAGRIFDEFVQVDAATRNVPEPGTGLGLTISRRLARLLGGSIGVDSVPGEGSTFWLDLPADPPNETGR